MQELSAYFDRFVNNISLGEPQISKMDRAAAGIENFLRASYGLTTDLVFQQGSYANGTAIEPVDNGEYDVDIVAVCVDDRTSAAFALNDLQARFKANGNYRARVTAKTPCVRLEYAEDSVGKFHIDVVPVRKNADWSSPAPLDAPRRNSGWHETAPLEYTAWCAARGEYFVRTVKVMKRWRDEQQSVRGAIKSIVLQVLVAECMPGGVVDDQARLVETFNRLHARLAPLATPPVIRNPVLSDENLAKRWDQASFDSFVRELKEAVDLSAKALGATDKLQAIDAWRELLGEDFPAMSDADLGLKIGDYSHAQSFAENGWRMALNPRYQVRVSVGIRRGRYNAVRAIPEEHLLLPGHKLRFTAHITAPNHVKVWWQVANTGGHARGDEALRGEIFRARSPSGKEWEQQGVTWESTRYTGVHLVRAILVRDAAVVSTSEWRRVNIFARNHPFRP